MKYTCFGGPFDGMEVEVKGEQFVLPEFDPLMGFKEAGVQYKLVKYVNDRTRQVHRLLKWVPR